MNGRFGYREVPCRDVENVSLKLTDACCMLNLVERVDWDWWSNRKWVDLVDLGDRSANRGQELTIGSHGKILEFEVGKSSDVVNRQEVRTGDRC